MASGYRNSAGTDFESLFAPGSGGDDTGYRNSGGTDLKGIFAPYTSGTKVSTTGYRLSNGTDLADRFQKLGEGGGSPPPPPPPPGAPVNPLPGNNTTIAAEEAGVAGDAYITFNTNGTITTGDNTGGFSGGNWYSPTTTSIGSNYWIKATVMSGATTSGTNNTLLSMGATRTWSKSTQGSCTVKFEIYSDVGVTKVAEGTYGLLSIIGSGS